jgi:hypothetical protein
MQPLAELTKDMNELAKIKHEIDTSLPEYWEEVEFVQGKYNRAVAFKSHRFHRRYPDHGFGTDENTGRMIWIGHFKDGQL